MDHRRRHGTELESLSPLAEHGSELLMNDLYQLLSRRDGAQGRDALGFLLDAFQEFAGELEVDVRFQQYAPYLAQSFLDVAFAQYAAATQAGERGFELFAQVLEHSLET